MVKTKRKLTSLCIHNLLLGRVNGRTVHTEEQFQQTDPGGGSDSEVTETNHIQTVHASTSLRSVPLCGVKESGAV